MRAERAKRAWALTPVLVVGLIQGLIGLRWGLPNKDRLAAFPPSFQPSEAVARELAGRWNKLYEGVAAAHRELKREEPVTYVQGREEIESGWAFPPDKLLNSYRSFLLRTENPDEQKSFVVLARMRPWKLELEPLFIQYGGAFIYPLGAYLEFCSWLHAARAVPDMAYYLQDPSRMGALFAAARVFILLAHLLTLALLFDLGRRMAGDLAGALSALFFTLCPIVVATSHIVKPHPWAALWIVAAARFAYLGEFRLCGLAAGLGAGSNFSLGVFFLLPAWTWVWRGKKKDEFRQALGGTLLAVIVFLAANPYAVLARRDFLWETTVYPQGAGGSWAAFLPKAGAALGPPLVLAILWGLVDGWKRQRFVTAAALGGFLLLWAGLAAGWGFIGGVGAWRFFYPCAALFCLVAAAAVVRLPRPLALAAATLILVDGAARGGVYLVNMARDGNGTRRRAAEWIEKNVPAGATLGLSRYPQPATSPALRYDKYHLVVYSDPKLLEKDPPAFLLLDDSGASELQRSSVATQYELARREDPCVLLWARVEDETFFANARLWIMRRKSS